MALGKCLEELEEALGIACEILLDELWNVRSREAIFDRQTRACLADDLKLDPALTRQQPNCSGQLSMMSRLSPHS